MGIKNFIEKFEEWDQTIILKYNGIGGKSLTIFFRLISYLGRETIWLLLISFYLLIWYDPRLLSHIGATFLLGVIIIAPIKTLFKRDRPFETLNEIKILERKPTSRSFPSWHAYNVVSQGFLFSYLMNSYLVFFVTIILMGLVSFSRIQLGVHYPTDVICGSLIGIVGFILAVAFLTPLIQLILRFFELLITIEIQYQMVNRLLLQNFFYLLFVIGIFLLIIAIASYKRLKELFKE